MNEEKHSQTNELIFDLLDLSNRIIYCDRLIMQIDNDETKSYYTKQLLDMIEGYRQMEGMLKGNLVAIKELEQKQDVPINLAFRKLLKKLEQ